MLYELRLLLERWKPFNNREASDMRNHWRHKTLCRLHPFSITSSMNQSSRAVAASISEAVGDNHTKKIAVTKRVKGCWSRSAAGPEHRALSQAGIRADKFF